MFEETQIIVFMGLKSKTHSNWLKNLAKGMNLYSGQPTGLWGCLSLQSHAHLSYSQVPRLSIGSLFSNLADLPPLPRHQGPPNLSFILCNLCYFLLITAVNWQFSPLRQSPRSSLLSDLLPLPSVALLAYNTLSFFLCHFPTQIIHVCHLLSSIEVRMLCSEFYRHAIIKSLERNFRKKLTEAHKI